MYLYKDYGVVYTPEKLASFVSKLLFDEFNKTKYDKKELTILDPACGEGILLESVKSIADKKEYNPNLIGIDVDKTVISNNKKAYSNDYSFILQNAIVPSDKITAYNYWRHRIKDNISLIIANPPWSSEKVFEKNTLINAGYELNNGQVDSYVFFIELCLKLLDDKGLAAFIIPDSLFSGENTKLREYITENLSIMVIARLGEKIFPNINRATSILIVKKENPKNTHKTKCYRLNTKDRKAFLDNNLDLYENFLSKYHYVDQLRFKNNINYVFDIDVRTEEESLLNKIETNKINWSKLFRFGRGVEISKSGNLVICQNCNYAQGYSKQQLINRQKSCINCGKEILFDSHNLLNIISSDYKKGYEKMSVGENLHRYSFDGARYIKPGIKGVNYKNDEQYFPPKILIRKTGLGIYACIDYSSSYYSQTIYSCNYINCDYEVPLEYYLGVLNSRVIYYYYLKKYGENEWKSHPYLTKEIIFSLPIREVTKDNYNLCVEIAEKVKKIQNNYSRDLDFQIEELVIKLYGLSKKEVRLIMSELNSLPDLSAINQMKVELKDSICIGI